MNGQSQGKGHRKYLMDDKVIKHGIHYLANLFLICVINAIRFIFNVQWLFFF